MGTLNTIAAGSVVAVLNACVDKDPHQSCAYHGKQNRNSSTNSYHLKKGLCCHCVRYCSGSSPIWLPSQAHVAVKATRGARRTQATPYPRSCHIYTRFTNGCHVLRTLMHLGYAALHRNATLDHSCQSACSQLWTKSIREGAPVMKELSGDDGSTNWVPMGGGHGMHLARHRILFGAAEKNCPLEEDPAAVHQHPRHHHQGTCFMHRSTRDWCPPCQLVDAHITNSADALHPCGSSWQLQNNQVERLPQVAFSAA